MDQDAKLDELWKQFDVLFEELLGDVKQIEQTRQTNDSQCWRRALCRSLFSMMEGLNSWLKRYAAEIYWPGIVDNEMKQRLLDRRTIVDRDGRAKEVSVFKPFAENFFYAFDTFAWTAGSDFCPDRNSREWTLLTQCIRARNRIVHPRTSEDLMISDEEARALRVLAEWYIDLLDRLLHSTVQALARTLKRTREAWCKYHPDQANLLESFPPELHQLMRELEMQEGRQVSASNATRTNTDSGTLRNDVDCKETNETATL